jgi:hypothetical protein
VGAGHAAQRRPRAGDRDLLSGDGPDEQLVPVRRARRSQPGTSVEQRSQQAVATQPGVDRRRIGVEVEDPPHGRERGLCIGRVGGDHRRRDVVVTQAADHHGRSGGEHQRARVRVVDDRLHSADGPCRQEPEQLARRERA